MKRNNENTPSVKMGERPKNKTFEKIKRIVSSVIIAIIVWFVTINVVNPSITVTMSDVAVRFVGESALRDKGLVLVDREELPSFSVKVRGTRRELLDGMDKIRVEIDLSGISDQGEITSYPTVSLPDSISLEKQKFSSVELKIEPSYKKEIPIVIKQTGTDRLKNTIVASEPEIDRLQITGSKAEVTDAQYCIVSIDASGIMESGKTMYSYQISDSDQIPLAHTATIYISYVTIPVNNTVYQRYTTAVKVEPSEELSQRYAFEIDSKSISPQTVDIGVPIGSDAPKEVTAIFKNEENKTGSGEFTAELESSENVYVKNREVKFRATIKNRLEITAPVAVEVTNLPDGLTVEVNPLMLTMRLSVPEGEGPEIKATADASGCKEGEYNLSVEFENENIRALDGGKIHVMIKAKQ